jgi:basic amino acid/polyamine antiporter, APA family
VVIALYGLLLIVTIGTLDASILGTSSTAIADSARTFMGKPGFVLLTIAAMLAFVSTANAGILAASRYPFALSRDLLLPSLFAKVHPKTHTPFVAILLTAAFISFAIIIPLELLVKAASAVIILTYILLHTTIIILRESNIQNYQPSFTSPFYPWNQLIGLAAFCVLLIKMGTGILLTSFALICVGIFVYFLHGRFRASKEFALMHLVARIMNKEIQNSVLEKELKQVLHNRDEISYDRFDHLVEDADLIDIKEKINLEELMEIISNDIENKVHIEANNINQLLHERERDSSTAISPFVAIPHLIVEGEKIFELLIIRARKGVYFSEVSPSVKAIFVLYGSKDERTFHLQALASIAQIIQTAHFDELWLKAKRETNLKDILLLADRRRFH